MALSNNLNAGLDGSIKMGPDNHEEEEEGSESIDLS